jgi:pullulanase-type alpha-1,6-glucosidase
MNSSLKSHLCRAFVAVMLGASQTATARTPAASLADCDAPSHERVLIAAADPGNASAVWLDRRRLRWPGPAAGADSRYWLAHAVGGSLQARVGEAVRGADGLIALALPSQALPPVLAQRFKHVAAGAELQLPEPAVRRLPALLQQHLLLVETDAAGHMRRATAAQTAGVLDDLYAAADRVPDLGVALTHTGTAFRLWAPTARDVAVCLHDGPNTPARALVTMRRDTATGTWAARRSGDLTGRYYTYLVDVFVRGVGLVRNRVTDPYSISLSADSKRSWIGRLDAAALKPPGWDSTPRPGKVAAATDMVIYELHVRDFSIGDATVKPGNRGKYLAFTESASDGMRHLLAMADAGLTDVHLLPVFDLASVPEAGCTSPEPARLAAAGPSSSEQQALVGAQAATDCFNWGYDPLHFNAPEGSFASDADDGARRILEFRAMVQALHRAGLRVGMDVVYNHTSASGQRAQSVLDRIVPGYYQRLNAKGEVEQSTCCENTATEHMMMARLMIDSAVLWAREHRIDSFRFDLMGHQPRAAMERLQQAVNRATGRHIHLIGEGWNFGEVKDGARFVQASQLSLAGSGIATFSDRARDALRGGGYNDGPQALLQRQGWINGLHVDRNPHAVAAGLGSAAELLRSADLVRVGLAGTLRDYRLQAQDGSVKPLSMIDYAGLPAGYASQPGEVVNYADNHDNQTLFDINVFKLPQATSRDDRARAQVLGMAVTALSQGIAYFHAGIETLRSKSLDGNSFDSGDWFNRLDWTFSDNFFATGLPPERDNGRLWPVMKPLLEDPGIKPGPAQIRFTRDAFLDLLRIRASSSLLRLRTADEVAARLRFVNTGPAQNASVVAATLDGRGHPGAGWSALMFAINANPQAQALVLPELQGRRWQLHPVHLSRDAADKRPAGEARWDSATGTLHVPARTAVVYVER